MDRRTFIAATATLAAAGASAQSDRPLTIIFPYAAGGSGDATARLIAEKLRVSLGRTVIVENRTGAGGRLGVAAVKNAPPDGSTLLLTPIAPVAVFPHVYPKLEYNPFTDLAPVSQISTFDFGIAVHPSLPVKSMQDFVTWVKANPDKANYSTPGAGTLPHFFAVLTGRAIGVAMNHVPYKGSAPAVTDLVSGHMPVMFTTNSDLIQQHKAGAVRIIVSSDKTRSPQLPEVATMKESGFDITGTGWYAAFTTAGSPPDVVAKLSAAVAEAVRQPDVREKLLGFGMIATGTTGPEMAAIMKRDSDLWEPVIKASGFKPDQ